MVVSPDDRRLAFLGKDGRIGVLDLATSRIVRSLAPPRGDKPSVWEHAVPRSFSADGRRLVVQGQALSVWELETGKQLTSWDLVAKGALPKERPAGRHTWERLESVAVSADGKKVAFGLLKDRVAGRGGLDWFGRVLVFEAGGKLLGQFDLEGEGPERLAFSPDGKRLAAGGAWAAHVWDLASGKKLRRLDGHRGRVTALAFSPDGRRLATASEDSMALVWDLSGR
jgi:WD40 repeat protein